MSAIVRSFSIVSASNRTLIKWSGIGLLKLPAVTSWTARGFGSLGNSTPAIATYPIILRSMCQYISYFANLGLHDTVPADARLFKEDTVNEDSYEVARLLRSAAVEALHFLTHGDASTELAAAETEFHHGDDPIKADQDAQSHFEQGARDHARYGELRIVGIVGEERIKQIEDARRGDRVIVVDPLDGSRPWSLARIGFCVAALALIAH